ncbi:MAG: hypothetical protein F6K26_39675 [Moorea sp. SIO2I5]|nr:hypothetical protein [Moorena sp. SIO2I5]
MNLSGQQRKKLQEALIKAFPDKSSLEQMLSFELDKNLDAISGGADLEEVVFELIQRSEAENWIKDLIYGARESNSGNQSLQDIATELLSSKNQAIVAIQLGNIQQEKTTVFKNKALNYSLSRSRSWKVIGLGLGVAISLLWIL